MSTSTSSRPLGPPGLEIAPGDHICAFFRGPVERDTLLFPFLEAGVLGDDKCFCLVDTIAAADVRAEVERRLGRPVGHHLEVLESDRAYHPPGGFSPEAMVSMLEAHVDRALGDEGFPFARIVGEMTSTLTGEMRPADLLAYETAVNRFIPTRPQMAFCLYDVDRFDGGTILDMIRVHPKMLLNGELIENPYYLPA